MCRHLAYLGPPSALADPLYDRPHALVQQAAAPRDMRGGGTVNADGFGLGWFPQPGGPPVRYRRVLPIWADPDLPGLAAATRTSALLAAVRSATPGMPVTEAACAPFAGGPGESWLFSLNGRIAGWPDAAAGLAARLPVTGLLTLPAPTDSALLWALLRQRLAAGEPAVGAVTATIAEVLAAAPASRLNLLLTDSQTVVASTVTHALWVHQRAGAVLVSSEPLDDDPGWRPVPDRRLVVATQSGVDIQPLPAR